MPSAIALPKPTTGLVIGVRSYSPLQRPSGQLQRRLPFLQESATGPGQRPGPLFNTLYSLLIQLSDKHPKKLVFIDHKALQALLKRSEVKGEKAVRRMCSHVLAKFCEENPNTNIRHLKLMTVERSLVEAFAERYEVTTLTPLQLAQGVKERFKTHFKGTLKQWCSFGTPLYRAAGNHLSKLKVDANKKSEKN